MGLTLVVVGLVGLTAFLAAVWLPLGLLPFSIAAIAAGLVVDWGSLHGKSSAPADQSR